MDRAERIRTQVDGALDAAIRDARVTMVELDPASAILVDEIGRLVGAGGKRLRPAFCVLGFRAAGGDPKGDAILRAAAALELLHAMALIHDDLIDESPQRRGVASSYRWLGDQAGRSGAAEPARTGRSLAILAGDLAAVLADRLLLDSGFPADRLVPVLRIYASMRVEMAAGQVLDVTASAGASAPGRVARMRGGSYTVAEPLAIGATLGDATPVVIERLAAYGEPLGEAFQLMDDLRDNDRGLVDRSRIRALVHEAIEALDPEVLPIDVVEDLADLAGRVGAG